MLKKIISVFTVLVLGFVFTACGSNQTSNDENKTTIRYCIENMCLEVIVKLQDRIQFYSKMR